MDYLASDVTVNAQSLSKLMRSDWLLFGAIALCAVKLVATLALLNVPANFLFADITKGVLHHMVNETRLGFGLRALDPSPILDEAAALKARDMVDAGYFSHTSPTGVTPWHWFSEAGYRYQFAGENLAVGFYDSREVYEAWLASPTHRDNVLNPNYQEIGTAVLEGFGEGRAVVVVQLFGTRKPSAASVAKVERPAQTQVSVATVQKEPIAELAPPQPPEDADPLNGVLPAYSEWKLDIPAQDLLTHEPFSLLAVNAMGEWAQNALYGLALFASGVLLSLMVFAVRESDLHMAKQSIVRFSLLGAIITAGMLIDGAAVIAIIPHQVII